MAAAQAEPRISDADFLEQLGRQYAERGFEFTIGPMRPQLPDFLGSYRPDAIARKPGMNIAVEVKRHPGPDVRGRLQQLRMLFQDHPDWQFTVAYSGTDPLPTLAIGQATAETLRKRMEEVSGLSAKGYNAAAFVLAWSLLEAAAHRVDGDTAGRPRTPGSVVQTLAMLGYLEPEDESRLRALVDLRNRIVHGDLDADPVAADIAAILAVVSATLVEDDG